MTARLDNGITRIEHIDDYMGPAVHNVWYDPVLLHQAAQFNEWIHLDTGYKHDVRNFEYSNFWS